MTRGEFQALLDRRDRLEREHTTACAILEEEGPDQAQGNYRRCVRIYDELAMVQERIDAELAAERAEEETEERAAT